jgi:hypothetical protein
VPVWSDLNAVMLILLRPAVVARGECAAGSFSRLWSDWLASSLGVLHLRQRCRRQLQLKGSHSALNLQFRQQYPSDGVNPPPLPSANRSALLRSTKLVARASSSMCGGFPVLMRWSPTRFSQRQVVSSPAPARTAASGIKAMLKDSITFRGPT